MSKEPNNKKRIINLYQRYMNNDLSKKELDELFDTVGLNEISEYVDGPLKATWQKEGEDSNLQLKARSRKKNRYWWLAAASVLLIFGYFGVQSIASQDSWEEYHTNNAQTKEVHLSDGSTVLLNANTTIKWNKDWEKQGQRNIEMKGEAYFDIAHMEDHPLKLVSTNALIEVLGTSFNVREGALGSEVYLHDGKIKLKLNKESQSEDIIMEQGDYVAFIDKDQKVVRKSQVEMEEAASWTKGELRYINQPLGLILSDISRIYGKDFQIQDTVLASIPMDVGFPYANWEVMTTALELALSIQLIEEDDKVIVKEKE